MTLNETFTADRRYRCVHLCVVDYVLIGTCDSVCVCVHACVSGNVCVYGSYDRMVLIVIRASLISIMALQTEF